MKLTERLNQNVSGVFFGGNWTSVNLKEHLTNTTFEQAIAKVQSFNTIALLTFHIDYYVSELAKMLNGGSLDARDKLSFELPHLESATNWNQLVEKMFTDAQNLIRAISVMPESKLWQYPGEEKYGDFFYNIIGIIEHTHYHLGQIVLIRKIINTDNNS